MNQTIHDEENSSEAEDDTSEKIVIEMQTYENNGEQNKPEEKLLTTNFEVKVENRKFGGLTTYSTDQQIFELKVYSETDQEVWGVYIDFQSIHSKWTIDAILQHMGFYITTENPNVMMKENHDTQSSEYIMGNVDGLITYSTDQQIFKFKVNSGTEQEVWGVYIDFQSIHSKWTIDAILQHMGFYVTTENPNVMMRENHNTQSSEYIIICQSHFA